MASIKSLAKAILPAGLRSMIARSRLRRRHGIIISGSGEPIQLPGSSFGRMCRIAAPVYIGDSSLGDYSYVEPNCRISSTDIGKFCSIAPGCIIGPLAHPLERTSTHPAFYLHAERFGYSFVHESSDGSASLRTTIGNDVWLGAGVFVRRGVAVGDGAAIGAGAVVLKDVQPYSIVAGVPARVIRMRFDDETIARLLELRWWDRDETWLREHAHLFADVTKLLATVSRSGVQEWTQGQKNT